MLTMQDALLRLTEYWAARGCLIVQPMNTEVGAGTLNPATALRVLGPEPWRVAYVEPSVRPDDSRYGDNPNRIQTHTQFQVILKPEPGDPQDLYLRSLEALGIDLGRHDVRFVEDNWASPALGAWGLGWEVWLDGLEITQFTYFQQSGGLTLEPVCVELTYGMERILMALQGVSHFKDIRYAPGVTYGEAFGQAEYEMSRYYLDDADIEANRALFEAYAAEAARLVRARLPVPAHTYVLKCSHAFNVLDARGAIGTTERARAFARMRGLAQEVAALWVERRRELGFPLGVSGPAPAATAPAAPSHPAPEGPAPLAFEIGTEEMPPSEVDAAAERVRAALREGLGGTRLRHGEVRVVASPRRIVALVEAVHPREDDHEQTVRGPHVRAAFDDGGAPTAAARGFARAQGVDVERLERVATPSGEYVAVRRTVRGREAARVLAELLPGIVSGLRAERNMRWSAPGLSFTRPIRWLLALLGDQIVPFAVSNLISGRTTHVHRKAERPTVEVEHAGSYLETLLRHGIVADGGRRRETIRASAAELATAAGGTIDAVADASLIDEIANLVEQPVAVLGRFDEAYLELPAEVLTTVMEKHQRYLPVRDGAGRLMPAFVAFANGACDADLVRGGYEAVLRARYEDASFFWSNDLRVSPQDMKRGLAKLTFEERLGSMADRAGRIRAVAVQLAERARLSDQARATVARAGELAKFDLASEMVIELSSLAGLMAREYARRAGEPEAVAQALFELELPRYSGDALPSTPPGAVLALADRFDLLAGLFAVGSQPTGSSDPFGMRRAALGVTGILCVHPELSAITVRDGLAIAARHQPVPPAAQALDDAFQFIVRRLEQQLLEAGHPAQVVRAVLPLASTPARAEATARELEQLLEEPGFQQLTTAIQRVRRIVPPGTSATYDPMLFQTPAERTLHESLNQVAAQLGSNSHSLREFAAIGAAMVKPIEMFFEDVLVMAEDPKIRANRLGLLASVEELGAGRLAWQELD